MLTPLAVVSDVRLLDGGPQIASGGSRCPLGWWEGVLEPPLSLPPGSVARRGLWLGSEGICPGGRGCVWKNPSARRLEFSRVE